ncbi:MAG: sensor histidine kinase [Promethearchaeota archaeon]
MSINKDIFDLLPEILDYMDNSIIIYKVIGHGQDFIIKYVNNAAERLDNFNKEDFIGQSALKFYPEIKTIGLFDKLKRVWEKGLSEHHMIPYYKGKIIELWRDFHIYRLSNGDIVTSYNDITEKEKAEIQLRDAYNRSEFYRDLLSHDIRNIIQMLISSSEIGLSNLENIELIKNYFKKIFDHAQRAANLINSVQKLFKLEETEQNLRSIELCEVLTDSINLIKESYLKKTIKIKFEPLNEKIYVMANEFLHDIFDNLLNNAIKFDKNPIIEILIKISRETIDGIKYIKIEFIDKGIGIPDQDKEKIFQRYYRTDKEISGMGLGLSVVEKIIDSYKGKIWVQNRIPGDYSKGSNFIILIPEAKNSPEA